jgi:peptidoglycan/xylan/chitin deacetylase (PgdA/CDA1 family)
MHLILNFHGLGEAVRPYEEGEEPYWLPAAQFKAVLDLAASSPEGVGITFDDGNDSDFTVALPELRARSTRATFFVLAGKIDQPGYLTSDQVRAIDADPLFSIGSHGMDHRPWPILDDEELLRETAVSQDLLSAICGRRIEQVGLPFGRYDRRTLRRLAAQGYTHIYSSDGSPRLLACNPIPRLSVRKDTDMKALAAMIAGGRSWLGRFKRELTATIKANRNELRPG